MEARGLSLRSCFAAAAAAAAAAAEAAASAATWKTRCDSAITRSGLEETGRGLSPRLRRGPATLAPTTWRKPLDEARAAGPTRRFATATTARACAAVREALRFCS